MSIHIEPGPGWCAVRHADYGSECGRRMPRRRKAAASKPVPKISKAKGASSSQARRRTSPRNPPAQNATAHSSNASDATVHVNESERTCRRCHMMFLPSQNHASSCRYHPEIFTGETKQRWMESGESLERARRDGSLGEIHYFWTCCGQDQRTAPGCAHTRHSTYDDPPDGLTYT